MQKSPPPRPAAPRGRWRLALPLALLAGMAYGAYLRFARPERYALVGKALNERELDDPAPEAV